MTALPDHLPPIAAPEAPTCPDCSDTGRISNGRDPLDPGFEDGPCPNPECEAGAEEYASAMRVREAAYTGPRVTRLPQPIEQALAPFAPLDEAA